MTTPKRKKSSLQADLVAFAYDHRFITAEHVRYHFGLARATAARHLEQLTGQRYLAVIPVRHALASFPHVYVAAPSGLAFLQQLVRDRRGLELSGLKGEEPRRGRPRDIVHLQHELDCTAVDLAAARTFASFPHTVLARTVRRYHRQPLINGTSPLIPDAGYYVLHSNAGHPSLDLIFLELDRGTESPGTIQAKLHAYDQWAASPRGHKYLRQLFFHYGDQLTQTPNFRLLVVAQARAGEGTDLDRLATFAAALLDCSADMRRRTWLASADDIAAAATTTETPFAEPVFRRIRGDWVHHYQLTTDKLRQSLPELDIADRQKAYLANEIDRATRLPLLPVKEAVI